MKIHRLAALLGALLILTAVGAVYGLRHGSFASAAGFNPLAADSVRVEASDGTVTDIFARDSVLELIACLNEGTYTPVEDAAEESPALTFTFRRGTRTLAQVEVGRTLTAGGRRYAVRGLDMKRLRRVAGLAS